MSINKLHTEFKALLDQHGAAAKAKEPSKPTKPTPRSVPLKSNYRQLGDVIGMDPYVVQAVMEHGRFHDNPMVMQAFKRFLVTARTALDESELPITAELQKVTDMAASNQSALDFYNSEMLSWNAETIRWQQDRDNTEQALRERWHALLDDLIPAVNAQPAKGKVKTWPHLNGNQECLWASLRNHVSDCVSTNDKHMQALRRLDANTMERVLDSAKRLHRDWIERQLFDENAIRSSMHTMGENIMRDQMKAMPHRDRLAEPKWDQRALMEWANDQGRHMQIMVHRTMALEETRMRREQLQARKTAVVMHHRAGTPGYEEIYEHLWEQWCQPDTHLHHLDDLCYEAVNWVLRQREGKAILDDGTIVGGVDEDGYYEEDCF